MKVSDLSRILSALPVDMEVYVSMGNDEGLSDFKHAIYEEDGPGNPAFIVLDYTLIDE